MLRPIIFQRVGFQLDSPLYKRIQLDIQVLIFHFLRIQLAPDLPARNYIHLLSRRVSVQNP